MVAQHGMSGQVLLVVESRVDNNELKVTTNRLYEGEVPMNDYALQRIGQFPRNVLATSGSPCMHLQCWHTCILTTRNSLNHSLLSLLVYEEIGNSFY